MEDKPFFSQGAYGCAIYPRVTCKGTRSKEKTKKRQKIMSKIVENSLITQNEIRMGKIVNKLMKRKRNKTFIGVSRHCKTKYENISKFKQCNVISDTRAESQDFLILYSRYIPSVKLLTYLSEDFTQSKWVKTYQFVLQALRILQKKHIVHHDFTANNIIVSKKRKSLHVIDFGLSFCIQDCFLNQSLRTDFLKMLFFPDTSFYLWPIDHHILGFMVRKGHIPNQEELMYLIRDFYFNRANILFQFEGLEQYVSEVYTFYEEQYILSDMHIEDHIRDLITHASLTWDLYTISYTLLRCLVANPTTSLEYMKTFLKGALHYDYTKRHSLQEHLQALR